MSIVIAFFYYLNSQMVSYTVSEFTAFKQDVGIPGALSCPDIIKDPGFIGDVRNDLQDGQRMVMRCYSSPGLPTLGDVIAETAVEK